jgi:predicted XRE-type DNA-binding protein
LRPVVWIEAIDIGAFREVEEVEMRSKVGKKTRGVFHDLGFNKTEAENLRIRAARMNALIACIGEQKLTQTQAAKLLGVSQPRVSGLMRGKIHLFSIDTLVNLLSAVGLTIDLHVCKAA